MRGSRHPVHAAFVHFPIALLGTSLAFDLLGLLRAESLWWAIAFWNVALGLSIGLLTAATGLLDSVRVANESPASAVLTRHMYVVIAALSCYGAALAVRSGPRAPAGVALPATLALEAVGLGLLLFGAFLGGELVYRHGVGRIEPRAGGT